MALLVKFEVDPSLIRGSMFNPVQSKHKINGKAGCQIVTGCRWRPTAQLTHIDYHSPQALNSLTYGKIAYQLTERPKRFQKRKIAHQALQNVWNLCVSQTALEIGNPREDILKHWISDFGYFADRRIMETKTLAWDSKVPSIRNGWVSIISKDEYHPYPKTLHTFIEGYSTQGFLRFHYRPVSASQEGDISCGTGVKTCTEI